MGKSEIKLFGQDKAVDETFDDRELKLVVPII